jgi:hypothetical protein
MLISDRLKVLKLVNAEYKDALHYMISVITRAEQYSITSLRHRLVLRVLPVPTVRDFLSYCHKRVTILSRDFVTLTHRRELTPSSSTIIMSTQNISDYLTKQIFIDRNIVCFYSFGLPGILTSRR